MAAPATTEVRILSRRMVRPSSQCSQSRGVIHLTPWDLKLLSVDYIQKGILFLEPPAAAAAAAAAAYNAKTLSDKQREEDGGKDSFIISGLLSSFARALDHFFPLAGRLVTAKHHEDTKSLSIFLDCNDEGAEFIHAFADNVTVSDVLTPLYIPPVVQSFFPLNGVLSCDGHSMPLLAVQVTELADGGIFVGCSLSHAVADGTSFWHFFNSWSHLGRDHHQDFIRWIPYPPVRECALHFSARTIANIKSRANTEMGTDRISSLQALLGFLWRSVTRARRLDPAQETTYFVLVGCRSRLGPSSLPATYLGNALTIVQAKSTAGELSEHGPGWAAFLLNRAVASSSGSMLRDELEMWTKEPSFTYMNQFKPCDLITGSSPRFNIYDNDFGWGRPVAVRSGPGNKVDGKATIYPGPDPGSMALEVCLSPQALSSLIQDQEFMQVVTNDEAS